MSDRFILKQHTRAMRLSLALSALAATASVANGFTAAPRLSHATASSTSVFMSEPPSDTSTDDESFFVVEEEADIVETSESLVNNVLSQLPTYLGDNVADEVRKDLNEIILKLEAVNPTVNPAMSPLLNGVWELRYASGYSPEWTLPSPTRYVVCCSDTVCSDCEPWWTSTQELLYTATSATILYSPTFSYPSHYTSTSRRQLALFLYSGGYSPGLFALSLAQQLPSALVDVGDLEITIARDQPRVEAKVTTLLLNGSLENSVSVRARLEVESAIRLKETYESATVLDQEVALPPLIQYSRDLYVTYVDEDLLVVRDASGVPEVLVRKVKQFTGNWGIEPSALDDMVPPGEELPATD